MLTAKLNGESILLFEDRWETEEAPLRAAARAGRIVAPCCGAPLVLRWGQRKVRHFAHPPRTSCPYERWAEAESPEHVAGKVLLYEWCRQHFGEAIRLLALEHPLPESLQRPDVYLELHDGTRYALEYQRSVITPAAWSERHEAYVRQGIHDVWILGDNRLADALPNAEQQTRWAAQEPHMHFLKLRAFEQEAAVRSPFEVAWWRGAVQDELWAPQELDARVGREVSPWYKRSALARLRSVTFLDTETGVLTIYRALRELPRHRDTQMASIRLELPLGAPEVTLSPAGFVTRQDTERLAAHEARVARLEEHLRRTSPPMVREDPVPYLASPVAQVPEHLPAASKAAYEERLAWRWPNGVDPRPFYPGEQELEQQRRLASRQAQPEWRKIVERFNLRPENLHFLIGIPILDDAVISTHRTVWQAYIYYRVIRDLHGSISAPHLTGVIARRFGTEPEMARVATYLMPGRVLGPMEVVGRFLNLMVATGYLRNDMGSELFRYHAVTAPPPALAFVDRKQRWAAWDGLLCGRMRLDDHTLVGDGDPVPLMPAAMADRPTPAQIAAVASAAARRGLEVDLDTLTYRQASEILSTLRRRLPH